MNKKDTQHGAEMRSLQDKAYDIFGEMLLEQETQGLLKEADEQKSSGNTEKMEAFFARHDEKNLEIINRFFHRQRARRFFHVIVPKVARVAAVFIAVFAIAGGVAIAASHTLRVQVMKLLTSVETEYTELSFAEDTQASFTIPAEWEGEYYPAYIPEDLTIKEVDPWPGNNSVVYHNTDTQINQIDFSERDSSTVSNIDTESSIVKNITINGNAGFLSIKDNGIITVWDNGRVYFVLITVDLDEATALRIAESVTRVK